MKVELKKDGHNLTAVISGSVDTVTAPELEKQVQANWDGITNLVLDFTDVDYISSAGLRVVMATDQHISATGRMTIRHANDDVKEVFAMTGFDELLHFE